MQQSRRMVRGKRPSFIADVMVLTKPRDTPRALTTTTTRCTRRVVTAHAEPLNLPAAHTQRFGNGTKLNRTQQLYQTLRHRHIHSPSSPHKYKQNQAARTMGLPTVRRIPLTPTLQIGVVVTSRAPHTTPHLQHIRPQYRHKQRDTATQRHRHPKHGRHSGGE